MLMLQSLDRIGLPGKRFDSDSILFIYIFTFVDVIHFSSLNPYGIDLMFATIYLNYKY